MSDLGLPTYVLTEIDSPVRETRLTAVDEQQRGVAPRVQGRAQGLNRVDRLAVDLLDHVTGTQPRVGGAAARFDARHQHTGHPAVDPGLTWLAHRCAAAFWTS